MLRQAQLQSHTSNHRKQTPKAVYLRLCNKKGTSKLPHVHTLIGVAMAESLILVNMPEIQQLPALFLDALSSGMPRW